MKRGSASSASAHALGVLLGLALWAGLGHAQAQTVDDELAERHAAAFREFQDAYQRIVAQVNAQLGLDYPALDRTYGSAYRGYRERQAIIETLPDADEKRRQLEALDAFFKTPEAAQYLAAKLLVENELDRDHLLRARQLQACEDILETLTKTDPLFASFFHSPEYQQRYGLLLKRVAADLPEGTSAFTKPLDAYTMFTDRTRMPVVITVSPTAFNSLAYLRSILIHELNHVLLYKTPLAEELERGPVDMAHATPETMSSNRYVLFFAGQHAGREEYQYHLLHEYLSFSAQLMYDDRVPNDPQYRLSPADRRAVEGLRQWAFDQMSPRHKAFVVEHSIPPIAAAILAHFPASGALPATTPPDAAAAAP